MLGQIQKAICSLRRGPVTMTTKFELGSMAYITKVIQQIMTIFTEQISEYNFLTRGGRENMWVPSYASYEVTPNGDLNRLK